MKYAIAILCLISFFVVIRPCLGADDKPKFIFEEEVRKFKAGRPARKKPDINIATEDYTELTGEEKIEIIKKLIATYKVSKGIIIKSPAELYVILIDDMIKQNPMLIDMPLKQVFENACIEIDDFEEGKVAAK